MQCVVCRYEYSGEGERTVEENKLLPVLGRSDRSSLLEAGQIGRLCLRQV